MFKPEDIYNNFKLPIEYNDSKKLINYDMKKDLELNTNEDVKESLYYYVFNPKTIVSKLITEKYSDYFTNDKKFITDSQHLIKSSNTFNKVKQDTIDTIYNLWNEIKNDKAFIDRYQYVDINYFMFLNNNQSFLQFLSMFNMTSPAISLAFPIIMLFIPFLLIKMQNNNVTFSNYLKFLKVVISNNSIGNLIMNFKSVTFDKKIYLCLSAGIYVFQIYQNFAACIRFYCNIKKIHEHLFLFRDYILETVDNIDKHLLISDSLGTYYTFNFNLRENKKTLLEFNDKLQQISPYKLNIKKLRNIGQLMKCYYQLFENKFYNDALNFSLGFTGYIDLINNLNETINNKIMNVCSFNNKKTEFKDGYYPPLLKKNTVQNVIKNSYKLNRNKVITGPNASGKTTLLKSTIFNIILSQQIGFGFYKSADIFIYDYIHCYLNIPDTSGRDSLFQAEARRCKEILDLVNNNKTKRHFCIFDELYSGTNPYEAISGAYAYLSYLTQFKNFNFLLTTHYVSLCEKIKNNKSIENNHMIIDTNNKENNDKYIELHYTYKLGKGISDIKGGVKVFKDLKYPDEVINNMQKQIKNAL